MARIEDSYGILREVAGMRPLFNIRDLEQRRQEIRSILEEVEGKTLTFNLQKSVVNKTFRLFFQSGSPWYRGLDNRELAQKVVCFLEMYNDVGDIKSFTPDLFACSMQLLHLSFKELDVTNTPAYVIQVIGPQQNARIDLGGSNAGNYGAESSGGKTEEV
jgi:hypothetical protein